MNDPSVHPGFTSAAPMSHLACLRSVTRPAGCRPGRIEGSPLSTRPGARLLVLAAAGTMALSACVTDSQGGSTNTASNSSPTAATNCATGDLKGAGSTFQKNIVAQWIKDFGAACSGANIDYQPVGSGAGITQFGANTIDFAGSDSTMKDDEQAAADKRCGSPAIHLPI